MKFLLTLMMFSLIFPIVARQEDDMDDYISQVVAEREVTGLAFALIQGGEVTLMKGYGWANVEEEIPVTENTVFNVASMGKAITAWATLKLVEEGKLDLDVPVSQYLTRWTIPESEFDADGVTIRRILSHTSGLGIEGYRGFSDPEDLPTLESLLAGDFRYGNPVTLEYEPGTQFLYSGGGYTVLQLVIEEVTGMGFAEYVDEAIFQPLEMTNSSFSGISAFDTPPAVGYNTSGRSVPPLYFTAQAAGGLYTSAADMTKFVLAHMPGKNDEPVGRGIISPESVQLATSATEVSPNYGFGYFVHPPVVWHDAFNRGWRGVFAISPDVSFVALSNSEAGYFAITDVICQMDFGDYCQVLQQYQG